MACRMENEEQGYDERRFEGPVKPDLFCSICHEVLRDPRTCQNREHPFCRSCISQHLRNSHTCPECRENLTPETLKNPRFLKNTLSELKIKCDHNERGCPGYVQLENLQNHVERCGFAPVMCENEGCGTVVNKRDKEIHEKERCQFRIAKCHDCRDIKTSQDEMKARQDEMKVQIIEIERKQDQVKDNVDEIKQTQAEMKADQMAFKAEVRNQFERMTEMLNQLLQGAQALDPGVPVNNQDIIIVGGWYGPGGKEVLITVEKFNVVGGKSTHLPQLNHPRAKSASCVYNGDVIVIGGHDGQAGTDSIEILKINQDPLRWMMFGGKLPVKLSGHDVIVYQGKLYVIGGVDGNKKKTSDNIYKLSMIPPYTAKLLARMPQPRKNHRAEIINGKLFILGGSKTGRNEDAMDSVVVYDLNKNELIPRPSLPKPVQAMSTVTWGNNIIVIGGKDKNDKALNDVIMYDTATGQSQKLPHLIHKRSGSSAVIMHDVIVVFGGYNKEEGHLNSVESFTMGGDNWRELPGMMQKRLFATAVVKPRN